MAQHDYVIANGTGAAVRSDINGALAAIVSQNSGATTPATTYAYQFWADTTTGLLKIRNAANSAWITLFQLDGEWSTLAMENGTAAAPSIYFKDSGTDTGFYSPGADQVGISTGGVVRLTTSTTAFTGTLPWLGQNGTAAAPALSFSGDPNTGFYNVGADNIGVSTNGTLRFDVSTTATTSTLPVVHPLGAVGTPSITFTGDLNTGIWSPAADTIAFSEGGAEVMRIDSSSRLLVGTSTASGNALLQVAGDVQVQSLNGGPIAGARQRLINGAMEIDQRNAGASQAVTTSNVYCVDRWSVRASTGSGHTVQQTTTVPTGFINSLRFTTGTGASPAAGDVNWLLQAIEGFNVADLGWGTANAKSVTLSFWVRSSLTGTFGGALQNTTNARSYPFTYTISAANTFEYKTITVAGDTTGTWLTNNSVGLFVYFGLGMGSTYNGTAGAWAGADYRSATGAQSVVGTSGATFFLTGVQLEAGSVATPFERRSYGQELALCQRYFMRRSVSMALYGAAGNSLYTTSSLQVEMRATPTATVITAPSYTNASGFATNPVGAADVAHALTITATGAGVATNALVHLSSEL